MFFKKILPLAVCFALIETSSVFSQTVLMSQNFGTSGAWPAGWTASGTFPPALSNVTNSSGYTGASGSYNVMFADNGVATKYLTYSNTFSTVGYTNITVLWGGRRNSTSSPTIDLYWSTDGATWNGPVAYTQPASDGAWRLVNNGTRVTLPVGAEGVANLRLRWQSAVTTTSNSVSYRLDDVTVEGTAGSVTNDECAGAIALTVNSTCSYIEGTSAGATQSYAGCSGTADDDVWFSFVALATTATVTVDPSASYDAAFELLSGACPGTQIVCRNSSSTNGTAETYGASGLTIGNTYYIRVWHRGAGSGSNTFDICVYSPITPCTSPTSIDGCGTGYTQTFSSNGSSTWSPDFCVFSIAGQEKVYSFTAPSTGTYTLVINSSTGNGWVDYGFKTSCTQTGWTCLGTNYFTTSFTWSGTAGNTYYFLVACESSAISCSQTFYMNCPAGAGANIALANNGTQVTTANVSQGTNDHILHKISLAVTGSNATLTGLQATTAGTYASADITNLKVRYSTNSTLDAGDATLSTYTTPGVAGTKTFPSFTSQVINSGSTGYIFITADVAAGATLGNTIRVNAITTSQLTFSSGTKTGSTSAGGYQTITATGSSNITLADNGTIAAANVKQGTSNHTLIKISLAVTTADATLTGLQATTAGTYASTDVTHLKVVYSTDNTLDDFDEVLSTYATPGAAGTKTFPSFISKTITSGTTGYIFITGYIAPGAVVGRTIRVNAITTAQLTFASGTKGGSSSNGGYQTVIAYTNQYDDISMAATLSNTNYLPQAGATWTTYSNSSATASNEPATPDSWSTAATRTLWFKFTATTTAQSVSTNYNAAASAITDTRIAIYSSSDNTFSGELTLIGENEDYLYDAGGSSPRGGDFDYNYWTSFPTYLHSALTVTGLTVGNTYFVRVDGSTSGNFRIATNTAPENDACETATDMTLNTLYNVDNTSATLWSNLNQPDAAFDIAGTATQENLIYFKFRPNETATYYINQGAASCDGTGVSGTQFLIFEAGIDCNNMPTLITGYDTGEQKYSSNTTTAARTINQSMTAGALYYLAMDGGRGDECQFTLRITKNWPYPIELESFKAFCVNSFETELQWKTATEINNDYFTIERSVDGKNYSSIGMVVGAGNSSVVQEYSYIDRDPIAGTSYYRITQTDYNGEKQTFSPLSVDCSSESHNFSMHVNGNLINGGDRITVAVSGAAEKKVLLVLTDIYGRDIYSTFTIESCNSYIYNIKPDSDIPAGLYFITASSNDKYVSKKIIVK